MNHETAVGARSDPSASANPTTPEAPAVVAPVGEHEAVRVQVFRICDKATGAVLEQTTSGSRAQMRRAEHYGLEKTVLVGVTMEFKLSQGRVITGWVQT